MSNILIIDSGLKPGWTKKTADTIIEMLSINGTHSIDRINIREEQIEACRGCALCLDRGEDKCVNYGDSAGKILTKMMWADGIITITPNYSLNVPWNLKNLYDRLAFLFHRPRLFGKTSAAFVLQGAYGGGKVLNYIDELMSFWGCKTVKGAVLTGGLYPNTTISAAILDKNGKRCRKVLQRFEKSLADSKRKRPSFFKLAIFRMTRGSMKYSDEVCPADKAYFREKGWIDSKYYYEVKLGPLHTAFGALMDSMIKHMILKQKK